MRPRTRPSWCGGVAESYSVSDDGKTITLKIRPGQTFHSGNPVRAEDVAFSLQRVIMLNKTPAFILSQLGWTRKTSRSMVKAKDDLTVELTITEDFAPTFVLNCLSAGVGSVVDKKLVLEHEQDGDLGYEWLKTNSAGSGAFVLKSWKANETRRARGQSRLSARRAGDEARGRPPRAGAGGAAPAAREGRRRHRPQPDRRPDPGDRRQRRHRRRGPSQGRHPLSRPQPEGRAPGQAARCARPCAGWSTTRAWRTASSRASSRCISRSGRRASSPR